MKKENKEETFHGLYLKKLTLNDFAIFEQQSIDFDKTFNAIIGETGSGKSLILEALEIILGQRADKKFLRKEAEFAIIEALFHCQDQKVEAFFEQHGHPVLDQEIIIKRIIYPDRPTKSFVNYTQCGLNLLIDFAKKFVDLVGQFENQKLMQEDYQLKLVDQYGKLSPLIEDYKKIFSEHQQSIERLHLLQKNLAERNQKLDYLRFQTQELLLLAPSLEDENQLIHLKNQFKKSEKLKTLSAQILGPLTEDEETNAVLLLKKSLKVCEAQGELVPDKQVKRLQEILLNLEDITYQLSKELNAPECEFDIDDVMNRLHLYQKIKSKYQVSTEELVIKMRELKLQISNLEKLDFDIKEEADLNKKLSDQCWAISKKLHQERKKWAKLLSTELTKKIRHLNMNDATLMIDIRELTELNIRGHTELSFLAETNVGEGFHSLKEIASGGELSRLLLACRQELATKDFISIFLFDEIDTGMGGETALKIGKALNDVSQKSQVIAITHLPQIAHCAEKLIVVSKNPDHATKRTHSYVKEVTGIKKKSEIAAMTPLH